MLHRSTWTPEIALLAAMIHATRAGRNEGTREDFLKADLYYRQVLRLLPNHGVALNNLAWLLAPQKKGEALVLARKALALEPESPDRLDTLGYALSFAGKTAEARQAYEKALVLYDKKRLRLERMGRNLERHAEHVRIKLKRQVEIVKNHRAQVETRLAQLGD